MDPAEDATLHARPILPTDLGELRTIMAADRTLMEVALFVSIATRLI